MQHAVILVPLDTSPAAEAVLPYAETLARTTAASLTLLSVVEPRPAAFADLPEDILTEIDGGRLRTHTTYLEQAATRLRGHGCHVDTATVTGDPADAIITAAEQTGARMVAMTAHGEGGALAPRLGGTADRVLRLGHRPVLVVPGGAAAAEPARIRHIMLPLDGSAAAESALCPAVELARALGARLALVRAEPWLSPITVPYSHATGLTRQDEHAGVVAEHYLDQVWERATEGVRHECFVLRGAPREELLRFAREEDIDLTVMTTHGRGALARRLLGSMAERLVRAALPVLLLPPHQAGE